jgi:hypothetical protein
LDNVSHIFCTYLSPEDVEMIAGCLSSREMADVADRGSPAKKRGVGVLGLEPQGIADDRVMAAN